MQRTGSSLTVVGLFAGVGGLELGLQRAGHRTDLLCEIDPAAQRVLRDRFDVEVANDVTKLARLPHANVITAGFPCQDLSQAGRAVGIGGVNSSLVNHVFRLITPKRHDADWVVLENVPFMLQLARGEAMRYVVGRLADLGYMWAYRIIDTRSFGLPQRRRRVIIVASRRHDPREVLFGRSLDEPKWPPWRQAACGFYWTEGNTGLGWAVDAVPTLKGGSGLSIASPPAIWRLNGEIGTPDIRDAERLQGFRAGWTTAADIGTRASAAARWKLIGNAVSVPVARWLGERLARPHRLNLKYETMTPGDRWPAAGWGDASGNVFAAKVTPWPVRRDYVPLEDFLRFPLVPLSARATAGFITRVRESTLTYPPEFFEDLTHHRQRVEAEAA